jgi:hypothetical protein
MKIKIDILSYLFIIRDKRKAQQAKAKRTQSEHKAKAKRTQAKAKQTQTKSKTKMSSNPRWFMESDWDEYDFTPEHFEDENRYNSKYGGNACAGCMGGSYIKKIYIKNKSYSYDKDDF